MNSARLLSLFTMMAMLPVHLLQAAAPSKATDAGNLPVFELKISAEEWAKLQRSPRSDDRHPAKFIAGNREYSVEVRYRGDWARTWPKKPLKIFFEKDEEFEGRRVLNLNSCWRDPAFIREQLAYQIYAACGVPSPKARMVRLQLNGQFYGLFVEVEQPDKSFLQRSNLKGATIYKANSHSKSSDERDLGSEDLFRAHYEKENQKKEGYRDIQSFCHELAVTSNSVEFFKSQVDLDEYINFLAATALVQNWDCLDKNHFLIHDTLGSKKWLVVPWDLDRTFGDHWEGSFDRTDLPLALGTSALPRRAGWNRLFNRFFKEPALRKGFIDRLDTLLQTEFTTEKLFPVLDQLESEIRADVAMDRRKWPNDEDGNLHDGIAQLKRYVEQRRAFLLREIKTRRASQAGR